MRSDLLIIGAGSGGLSSAIFASQLGLDVTLVERSPEELGGECLRNGCVPSKALLNQAHKAYEAKKASTIGYEVSGTADWDAVKEHITGTQDQIREHESEQALKEYGISLVFGEASFVDDETVRVDDLDITADNIIIATGSSPRMIPVDGVEDATTYTNESIFDAPRIPDKLLVVGGGPLGCELGQAMHRLGAQVTIVEAGSRLLGRDAEQAGKLLQEQFESEGIRVICDARLDRVSSASAWLTTQDGTKEVRQDAVLFAVGREPNTDGLGLDNAGITCDERGYPEHNDYLQTTNDSVYVVGDMTGTYQLSHGAQHEATTVVKNLVFPYSSRISYDDMNWVTYTDPEVATFGKTRDDLDKDGIRYETVTLAFDETDRAIINDDVAWGEVYVTGRTIRGGSIISDDASHIVQELVLAKQNGLKTTDFLDKIYPYPTVEEVTKISLLHHIQDKLPSITSSLARFSYRYL